MQTPSRLKDGVGGGSREGSRLPRAAKEQAKASLRVLWAQQAGWKAGCGGVWRGGPLNPLSTVKSLMGELEIEWSAGVGD